jgi:hypothetical protein
MISVQVRNKIESLFKNPLKKIIDYDNKHYVVEVDMGEDSEFYGVDKRNYEITNFLIAADISGYYNALENRAVYEY